jgi:hypothetical protein
VLASFVQNWFQNNGLRASREMSSCLQGKTTVFLRGGADIGEKMKAPVTEKDARTVRADSPVSSSFRGTSSRRRQAPFLRK